MPAVCLPYRKFGPMAWLRMASRVALVGNIAFAGCVLFRYITFVQDPAFLLILGWVFGIWFNLAVNVCVVVVWWKKRLPTAQVPVWLLWVNAGFCVIQLYYFFFI